MGAFSAAAACIFQREGNWTGSAVPFVFAHETRPRATQTSSRPACKRVQLLLWRLQKDTPTNAASACLPRQYGEEEVSSDRLDADFPDIDLSQLDTSDFDSVNCLGELQWCSDQQAGASPASVHYSTADELFEVRPPP